MLMSPKFSASGIALFFGEGASGEGCATVELKRVDRGSAHRHCEPRLDANADADGSDEERRGSMVRTRQGGEDKSVCWSPPVEGSSDAQLVTQADGPDADVCHLRGLVSCAGWPIGSLLVSHLCWCSGSIL